MIPRFPSPFLYQCLRLLLLVSHGFCVLEAVRLTHPCKIDHAKVPETMSNKSDGMLILDCQESGDASPTVIHSGKAEYHMASSSDQMSKSFMLFFFITIIR